MIRTGLELEPLDRAIEGPWRSVLCGAAVGLACALAALDPGFIVGTGGAWTQPQNDVVMYLVAWNYYLADGWRLPLFSIPAFGYPEGGSILFNDALPLTALVTKLLHSISGVRLNPFGGWILLSYVLQGAMAARLVYAAGARSVFATIAAATFALLSWSFLWRLPLGHLALSSHFLILWALALHFESMRRAEARILEIFALAAVALLVNPYLFVMVMVLVGATLLSLASQRRLGVRELGRGALAAAGLVAVALVAGYGAMLTSAVTMQAEGFGVFSWNLAGLLVPPEGVLGLLQGITRDATGGQYEGDAYVGLGALLFVVAAALGSPREALRVVRRHAWLCALLGLMALYAASNRVYLGGTLLFAYDLPQPLADLCQYFRASGRFIWPLAYSLAVLSVALVFRSWHRALAIALALVAVGLQLADLRTVVVQTRATTSALYPDLLGHEVRAWIGEHERIWVYPSWNCGSLSGRERSFGGTDANRELQIQLASSQAGAPTNSVYTSRLLKDCAAEAEWGRQPALEDGVLYFLGHAAVRDSAPLAALVRSGPCNRLPWAIACSTRSGFAAEGARSGSLPRACGPCPVPGAPSPEDAEANGSAVPRE